MRQLTYTFSEFGTFPVRLGRVGDHGNTQIRVNVQAEREQYPDAVFKIAFRAPDSLDVHFRIPVLDGSVLVYDVQQADVPVAGYGRMQILMEAADGTVLKSAVALTKIAPSLSGTASTPQTSDAVLQEARELLQQMRDIKEEFSELRPLIVDDTGRLFVGANAVAFLEDFESRISALEQEMSKKADIEWVKRLLLSVFLSPDGDLIFDTDTGIVQVEDGIATINLDSDVVYLNNNNELEVLCYGQSSAGQASSPQ